MPIGVLGWSHHTSDVGFRERLTWQDGEYRTALRELHRLPGIDEAVLLNTCNRTEIYFVTRFPHIREAPLIDWLAAETDMPADELRRRSYLYTQQDAARHLFRVAAGIDSMIVGETQVFHQVKQAYLAAHEEQCLGRTLHTMFHMAFSRAKQVRGQTGISQNAVSVSYAAVELARKIFGRLEDRRALLIGAGEVAELVAGHLRAAGIRRLYIANRTEDHAVQLATRYGGQPVTLDLWTEYLPVADVVISSTGSSGYVISREIMTRALCKRRRSLLLVDIAVPRDIDPAIEGMQNVFLYDIDDLKSVVDANLEERKREAVRAEKLIDQGVAEFMEKIQGMEAVPLIRMLREKAESIRKEELEQALQRMPGLDEQQKETVEALSRLIVNKLLNDPLIRVKEAAAGQNADVYLEAFMRFFDLQPSREGKDGTAAANEVLTVAYSPQGDK